MKPHKMDRHTRTGIPRGAWKRSGFATHFRVMAYSINNIFAIIGNNNFSSGYPTHEMSSGALQHGEAGVAPAAALLDAPAGPVAPHSEFSNPPAPSPRMSSIIANTSSGRRSLIPATSM